MLPSSTAGRRDAPSRFTEIAAEFVRLKVDLILANGTDAAVAAKQATSTTPIVFPVAADPLGSRLVVSLARPGGNVTGLSNLGVDLASKRIEILREVVPGLRRLGTMVNTDASGGTIEMGEIQAAVRTLGVEVIALPIRDAGDIASAFEGLKDRAEAIYVVGDALTHAHRLRINTFALAARLPTMSAQREFVEAAGLMSYGANFPVDAIGQEISKLEAERTRQETLTMHILGKLTARDLIEIDHMHRDFDSAESAPLRACAQGPQRKHGGDGQVEPLAVHPGPQPHSYLHA
jgi:ABC-type uncharacterized transport system substrate-binding protein